MSELKDHRPSWDEYFMTLANEVATRTTCLRRAVVHLRHAEQEGTAQRPGGGPEAAGSVSA